VDPASVHIVDFDDTEARLWTISENLHRNELHPLQRAEQVAEWVKLTEAKVVQVAPVSGGEQPFRPQVVQVAPPDSRYEQRGARLASRELGITREEVRRSVKIDSIIPAAKEAAREAGLDRNQSALLKVASYADEYQVEAVAEIAKAKSAPVPLPPKPLALRNLENIAAGEFARWIKLTTPNDRPHVIRVLEMAAAILRDELEAIADGPHYSVDIEAEAH
jgi:hypothetical protein